MTGNSIDDFRLKRFLNEAPARDAHASLSPSYAEPSTIDELFALDPDAAGRLARLTLAYPALHGGSELRAAIAGRYAGIAEDDVIVTCGSDDALALALLALADTQAHVIVQTPAYQSLLSLARWRGSRVSEWPAREERGWEPDLDELRRLLRPDTRLIVVNLPHNPTSFAPSACFVDALIAVGDEAGVPILSDEIYRGPALDGSDVAPPVVERSAIGVSLSGLSKTLGMPGLRIGWIVTRNAKLRAALQRLHMHLNSFVSAPSELLATIALRHANVLLERKRAIARANRDELARFFAAHAGLFAWTPPRVGVIAFARWLGRGTTSQLSAELLAERRLILVPSAHFDAGEHHARFGFGTRSLPAALAVLSEHLQART